MKVSIVIPVYYNEDNLRQLYKDIKEKFINVVDYDYEIVFVDDGSGDRSFEIISELALHDKKIKAARLSRNFGSHAAILCGLSRCTGDCAVVKAADLQEPTELLREMVDLWINGNNVVLAVREGREDSTESAFFSDLYYKIVQKIALPNMPDHGFDVYLVDRKVINVLTSLDETNSALTGQILWCGFKTAKVYYRRQERKIGTSRWTLKKKIKLLLDTLFSFTSLPISVVLCIGTLSISGAFVWAIIVLIQKMRGLIYVSGWTSLFIFNLFGFGVMMLTMGILGEYLWRTFDASRKRPAFIVEEENKVYVNVEEKNGKNNAEQIR